ncbi:MAG TPA: SAM-dependent methyltransferase, partial [Acidiphilium sp.]
LRLKGGDPFVFGRGGEECLALAAAGIGFRVIPGISAGIGGTASALLPITHRGVARSVVFATGEAGPDGGEADFAALAHAADTLVLYMARNRIGTIAATLIEAGRDRDEPVAFLLDATTPHERVIRTTLAEAASTARALPPAATLIVIGPVVGIGAMLCPDTHSSVPNFEPAFSDSVSAQG